MYAMRGVTQRDFKTIADLDWSSPPLEPWSDVDVARRYASGKITFSVAVDCHDTVIGYVAYRLRNRGIEMVRAVVAEPCRRAGVGFRITRHLNSVARSAGVPCVFAAVSDSLLPAAHCWLLACGWNQAERIKKTEETVFEFKVQVAATHQAGRVRK